ncbi:hypothetical protein TrispH2_003506 [Trichoplax sp. H2]|nr:hypothetical protein TrispH2_003506 [Trichoplax sp. H2]|eukprot:RDD45514.1 hypothetical protein TrispH2_003506 [Trichoplax sp. H2]
MIKIWSLFAIVALLPLVMPNTHHKPKSCYEVKQFLKATENGFFTLYDANGNPFRSFCDFESEPPFVWTLIESMTLENAQKAQHNKGFSVNIPLGECHTSMSLFRLPSHHMSSVLSSYGSTHYRSTCNFNIIEGTGLANRRDYIRFSACRGASTLSNINGGCVEVDYINIRGQSCRKCQMPFYASSSHHLHIDLSAATTTCSRFGFTNFVANEDVFGYYNSHNPTFSCTANKNSTTAWWIGGAYAE